MKHIQWLGMTLLAATLNVNAQNCVSEIVDTTPDIRFIDNGDGTVTHETTGLMWMQCSIGQTWSNGNCVGDAAQLNWQEALQTAHGFEIASLDGWRLPNVKELASLTERKCVRPAINTTMFPNTAADDYWTSTPSLSDPQRAWVVAFFNSSNSIKQKNLFVFARLVRTVD
ncbi:DUF1566 domain-containing protein [Aliiglaciecola litoralis]|uniref:Lcl C-terminal domain-containing protein n=1 Tax=Aliiglaciecola litoralis TaxID=582857 RepID=A0ABN1LJ17_9ALTE